MADKHIVTVDTPDSAAEVCWRQCSICMPSDSIALPPTLAYEPSQDMLMVATQTCSLTGKGAEPSFEVFAVRLIENFNSESAEAKGKITRYLQLALDGEPSGRGIRLDISRRAILDSSHLQQMKHAQVQLSDKELKAFQGWIARYYARIALPDELDVRLRRRQFHKKVEKTLNQSIIDRQTMTTYKVHSDIDRVYIGWSPDKELTGNENYIVNVLFVCRNPLTQEHLTRELSGLATGVKSAPLTNGLIMDDPDVALSDEVTFKQTSKMSRYTAYDEFSALEEVAKALGGE